MNANEQEIAEITRVAVREAMAEKEETDRITAMEELLGNAKAEATSLAEVIAAKEEELASSAEERDSLMAQLEDLRAETEKLKTALDESLEAKKDVEERASAAEAELASIEAEKRLSTRMSELEEAKVVKSGDKRTAQEDKIRGLSDEEFATYKEELVDFRTEWEAENAAVAEKAASEEAAEEETEEEEVPPADLEQASAEDAAAAAAATLNIEVASEDTVSRYLAWAKQMAANMNDGQG